MFIEHAKTLQFKDNIVSARSSNHPIIEETKDDPLSSPKLFLIPPKALIVLSIFVHTI